MRSVEWGNHSERKNDLSYLSIAGPAVVHETIEGEVVIVNLDKGLYFSIDGVGAHIWAMIVAGNSTNEIRAWGTGTFGAVDDVAAEFDEFLADLQGNDLVREVAEAPGGGDIDLSTTPAAYEKPALHVYADMEELLLLDPIHDVSGEAGWPHAAA